MSALNLGIAGCGDIAGFTAAFARFNRRIRLAACCDLSPQRAAAFGRKYAIPQVYTVYAEMLQNAGLDAVYLAVPHDLHFEMASQAAAAGKHILVEKPVTHSLAEGVELVHVAEQAGVKLAVNYQYRYDEACYRLGRAVQAGLLGEVRYARINIPWHRQPAYFEGAAWHRSLARAGGGTLITQGSHFLDVALWACGSPPLAATGRVTRSVFKDVEVEDLAMGILELENGALLEICSSMAAASEQAASIEIYASKATALYTAGLLPRLRFVGARVRTAPPPVFGLHALQRSLESFRRWTAGGPPHLAGGSQALPVLAAVEAIYRSARSGKTEKVQNPAG